MIHQRTVISLSLLILLLCIVATAQKPDLVIEVFRHGARGPLNQTYDPNPNYWGENVGQLTPVGMRMHYLLGTALKNRYPELLASYDADTIYVRSTDWNRTIMSGYSHMYGTFGLNGPNFSSIPANTAVPPYSSPLIPEMAANFNANYALPNNVQIIPIQVVPKAQDYELLGFVACSMALDWSDDNIGDSETLSVFQNDMNDIVTYLKSQNLKIETFKDLWCVGDNAISNMVQQIQLPGNVSPDSQYYKDFKFAFEWFTTKSVFGTQNQISLYSLNLLNNISNYMNAVANGTSPLNFVFLSAHDTTLMALLTAFNITNKDCMLANYRSDKAGQPIPYPNCTYPKFASDLIFEFYNTDEPYIVFYYDGLPVPLCGGNGNRCTLAEFQSFFKQVTNGYTQQDYLKMCQFPIAFPDTNPNPNSEAYKVITIVLAVVCFVLFVSLVILVYQWIKKSRELKIKEQLLLTQPQQEMSEISDREI